MPDGESTKGAVEAPPSQFRATKSAAELASADTEGYAEPGYAEHKGQKHLEGYWFRGSGGLRPEGHDVEDEEERLHELEAHQRPGMVSRAVGAVGAAISAVAGAVMPSMFKASKSAAELAAADTESYAEPGLSEHKGKKHLEEYWHRGSAGLRPEGHDYSEEEQRLHELEQHSKAGAGVVQRAKETVSATAAAATEKAGEYIQTAKEMAGMAEPKK